MPTIAAMLAQMKFTAALTNFIQELSAQNATRAMLRCNDFYVSQRPHAKQRRQFNSRADALRDGAP